MAHRRTAALAALTLSATGLTVAGLSGGSAQAADSTPGYSLQHVTVNVKVGPDHHPCVVDADIYKPDKASRTNKKPAILTTNGFGGSKDDSNESAIGRGFVKQGYVVLAYTGLGFPNSGCKITLDDPAYDGKAGKQMVSVLAGTKSYLDANKKAHRIRYVAQESKGDPRVGMIGGSYGGQIQYAVGDAGPARRRDHPDHHLERPVLLARAEQHEPHPRRHLRHPGRRARRSGSTCSSRSASPTACRAAPSTRSRNVPPCPNFADAGLPGAVAAEHPRLPGRRHPRSSRGTRRSRRTSSGSRPRRCSSRARRTRCSTSRRRSRPTAALRAQGTPTRMIWQSWGHSEQHAGARRARLRRAVAARLLPRQPVPELDEPLRQGQRARRPVGPRFSYFRDWVAYDTRPGYAGTAIRRRTPRSRRSRRPRRPRSTSPATTASRPSPNVDAGSASYANAGPAPTSYSETSGLEGSQVNNPPSDAPGTAVSFTTRPARGARRPGRAPRGCG